MDGLAATVTERVVQHLEQEIIEGKIRPGERLIEDEVAARLGVSRSPVREAFRALEHRGLVVVLPRKGVFVRPLDPKDAEDLYSLQASVTAMMARLAAARRQPADVEALHAAVAGMTRALETSDTRSFLARFVEFTRVLMRAAGNEWIERALRSWENTILRYGFFALSIPGYMKAALERYRAVAHAIEAGDGQRAEEALRTSIEAGGRAIAEALRHVPRESRGSSAPPDA